MSDSGEASGSHKYAALFQYQPFHLDFGPFSLGVMTRIYCFLDSIVDDARRTHQQRIIAFEADDRERLANEVVAVAYYVACTRNLSAEDALLKLSNALLYVVPFHDASPNPDRFYLSALDVLRGVMKAVTLAWLRHSTFSLSEYEH